MSCKKYEKSLAVIIRILDKASRKDRWLLKRAEVHILEGDSALAKSDLVQIINSYNQYPSYVRSRGNNVFLYNKTAKTLETINQQKEENHAK